MKVYKIILTCLIALKRKIFSRPDDLLVASVITYNVQEEGVYKVTGGVFKEQGPQDFAERGLYKVQSIENRNLPIVSVVRRTCLQSFPDIARSV